MALFELKGSYLIKSQPWRFTKELEAVNENMAREKLLALMGSKHKVKRRHIQIESVKKLKE